MNDQPISPEGKARLRDRFVLALWLTGIPMTTTDISRHYDAGRDSYSPRAAELEREGLIRMVGMKSCLNFNGDPQSMRSYMLTRMGIDYVNQYWPGLVRRA